MGSAQPKIEIVALHDQQTLTVSISDNGPGISQDIQSRMFDPFFTTKAPGKSTGLGLSVTRRLIQDSGGSINIESQPGAGCRILINFHIFDS